MKICGVTSIADAEACLAVGASAIGLNFVPSSARVVTVEEARAITRFIGERALVVLVVANLELEKMRALLEQTGARCLQLHGDESPETLGELLPHAYKAVRVGDASDVARARGY